MSRLPGWLDRVGAGLTKVGKRLEERRAEVTRDAEPDDDPSRRAADPDRPHPPPEYTQVVLPARPDPAQAVPWGVRVAAAEPAGACWCSQAPSGC